MWSCKNTWPKVSLTLWMKAAQGYSQSWQAGWPQALCQRRYNGFCLSRDLDVRKLISFIWVSSPRCTCFPNLVVIGLMEIAISILILVLTWIRWKKFSKSGIPIYNFEVPETAGRKTRRRRRIAQAIAKRLHFT